MPQKLPQGRPHGAFLRRSPWSSPITPIALGIAVGLTYLLAARLSLLLLTPADGVAVFWPAAGIASGALIALGSKARVPVAAGVMAATVAANLLGDRNLASAGVFALCNAGEALCLAWLIERRFGSSFSLDHVQNVLGLFAATAVAAAASGVAATAGFILFHNFGAPALTIWLNWFASDALGAITVAPLIVGLVRSAQDVPKTREILEGTLTFVVLAAASVITLSTTAGYWFTITPLVLILPLLLWLTARCRPLFAAMGVFALALVIVSTTTFGVGRLGDPSPPFSREIGASGL